jgi:hypothetical protein
MRLGKTLILATACVLGLSGGSEAAELFTPMLFLALGASSVVCSVSNVSDRDTTVRIEAFGSTGNDLGSSGDTPTVLPAGQTLQILVALDHARCKFTVANKSSVRAHGAVYQSGVGSIATAPAD